MRYLLVINPYAQLGIKPSLQRKIIKDALKILGEVEVFIVGKNKEEDFETKEFDAAIFCGGDGTLNCGIQKIYGKNIKMGIIPIGSGSDFSSVLKIPKDPKKALLLIKNGKTKRVDLGKVNQRLFINTVSFGFDAYINLLQEKKFRPPLRKIKRLIPFFDAKWSYVLAVLFHLAWEEFLPPELSIKSEEVCLEGRFHLLAITNSFRYGGGFKINPNAKIDDGFLDACLTQPLSKISLFFKIFETRKGTHIFDSRVKTFPFKKMLVKSSEPILSQVDGETLLPAKEWEIEVLPGALDVFVP